MNIFELKNVTKKYQQGDSEILPLKHINLKIAKNKITTILGPSGSGKTTLLNVISGLDSCDSGEIIFNDQIDLAKINEKEMTKYRRENVGFVFQSYNLINNLTLKENIQIGEDLSQNPVSVEKIIKLVGLEGMEDKMPYQLSGGQQQRIAIARILVKNPKVIFCDEPTGALDEKSGKNILEILQKLNQEFNTTIIMVTHNPAISNISHCILKFKDGEVVEQIANNEIIDASKIKWA